jgi:hypothetical protein
MTLRNVMDRGAMRLISSVPFALMMACSSPSERMVGAWRADTAALGFQDFETEIELRANGTFERRSRLAGEPVVMRGRWTAEERAEGGLRLRLSPQGHELQLMDGTLDGDVFAESYRRGLIRWTRVAR